MRTRSIKLARRQKSLTDAIASLKSDLADQSATHRRESDYLHQDNRRLHNENMLLQRCNIKLAVNHLTTDNIISMEFSSSNKLGYDMAVSNHELFSVRNDASRLNHYIDYTSDIFVEELLAPARREIKERAMRAITKLVTKRK